MPKATRICPQRLSRVVRGMGQQGDGDEGEDEGVEGRRQAIMQLRADLPVIALGRRVGHVRIDADR